MFYGLDLSNQVDLTFAITRSLPIVGMVHFMERDSFLLYLVFADDVLAAGKADP